MTNAFPFASVGQMLTDMVGTWHDHITVHHLDGLPMPKDNYAGAAGDAPYDNLVYIDFDGVSYRQTNITFRGRPLHQRTFTGVLREGVLHFDTLGPQDPGHIGISGGPNILLFVASHYSAATMRYSEPDWIYLPSPGVRLRSTVLYRRGKAVRTLLARGVRLSPLADKRHDLDPRGAAGDVHGERSVTTVYERD
jgi:hypothetical protein